MPYTKKERAKIKTQQFREQLEGSRDDEAEENTTGVSCCAPNGCLLNNEPVDIHDPIDVAKVVCNNPDCTNGEFMHRECFNVWEDEVLTFLRSSGRARSWSEKQRRQNLWTKKGYDLAWKACSCQCGKGHLRKDLDWIPPRNPDEAPKKPRKKKKSGDRPSINMKPLAPLPSPGNGKLQRQGSTSSTENHSPPGSADYASSPRGVHRKTSHSKFEFPISGNGNHSHPGGNAFGHVENGEFCRKRLASGDSFSGDTSAIRTLGSPLTTNNNNNGNVQRFTSAAPNSSLSSSASATNVNSITNIVLPNNINGSSFPVKPNVHLLRRIDFTSFKNALPSHKLNPYHIRMDDDNDDIRAVILSTLSNYTTSFMICTLCGQHLLVFDKYPLIDGTFFLTPQRHNDGCMQVYSENKTMYLGAVCVNCLAGGQNILCKSCKSRWDGSHHQLGTMYKYDIFAARPCCPNRVACNHCNRPIVDIRQGMMNYFSEYSQVVKCPHCGVSDYHFVKPLSTYELIPNH